jgi:AcrR family transcriptional regulator
VTSTVVVSTPAQERALDAALDLVARWGLAKTTLGDVARAAGTSRATLYRSFPGGKDQLFDLLARRELSRFLAVVTEAFAASDDLADALAGGLHAASTHLADHAAVRYILDHEPEVAVPVLSFSQCEGLLRVVRRAVAPSLVRLLPEPGAASWAAEWLARLFLSALVNPTPAFDLSDRAVCDRLVTRYVVPALARSTPAGSPSAALTTT